MSSLGAESEKQILRFAQDDSVSLGIGVGR